jgi:hypothetical protein
LTGCFWLSILALKFAPVLLPYSNLIHKCSAVPHVWYHISTPPSKTLLDTSMRLLACVIAFLLFSLQTLSKEFSPVFKRPLQYSSTNDLSYLGRLSRRDECSDSYGANTHNSICAPSKTLCCMLPFQVSQERV